MGAKKPKVKTYDPSKYEADLQMKKGALADRINSTALEVQKGATEASQEGIGDLYKSIGLLSDYMGSMTNQERGLADLYKNQGSGGVLSLYDQGKVEAKTLVDGMTARYRK
jgi:hypothetical protein